MTEWLGLPPLASAHGGQIDSMIGWVHVFMLILFVGWGGFFAYCLIRFRRSRNPVANYAGVKSHTSSYLEVGVAVVEAILLFGFAIPLWAARVDRMPPESDALVVQVTAEQFAWNVHYAGPDGKFGRTDIKLIDVAVEPPGARSLRSCREGRRHDAQSALSAREQADHREAQEQGRHPQLRRARAAREAGRHSGPDDPHLVRPHRHDRGDADPVGECRVPVRDCLRPALRVWAMPRCGDLSPSRPPRTSRSGWLKRSRKRSSPQRTPSGRAPPSLRLRRGRPRLR